MVASRTFEGVHKAGYVAKRQMFFHKEGLDTGSLCACLTGGGKLTMTILRRKFLHLTAGAAALSATSRLASAQAYPSRPITIIVPFAAGGPLDAIARIMADRMGVTLAQTVIVENVTGAEGTIGVGRAARARPDGYTVLISTNSVHVLNGAYYSLSYDLVNDFVPIAPLGKTTPIIIGRKTFPPKDLSELIVWLKAKFSLVGE
jgi:tripartite-type tricarboxylate transporter receptor subunit TctC